MASADRVRLVLEEEVKVLVAEVVPDHSKVEGPRRVDLAQAQAKLDWMRDRIRVPAAVGPARELHARAVIG